MEMQRILLIMDGVTLEVMELITLTLVLVVAVQVAAEHQDQMEHMVVEV
tara:strand:- start:685 stop:831 length:147 start_codon:yes stop_codon:yes gene_type:complete